MRTNLKNLKLNNWVIYKITKNDVVPAICALSTKVRGADTCIEPHDRRETHRAQKSL